MRKDIHTLLARLGEFALDTIAPPDPIVRQIERMSMAEFIAQVAPAQIEKRTDNIEAIFKYKDPLVKAAILELKSYGNKKMAWLLGAVLYERLSTLGLRGALLIPIPMTKKNQRARGWNQCELIGQALQKIDTGKSCMNIAAKRFELRTDVLMKVRQTGDQVGKGRAERFENLRDCFAVTDATEIRGCDVVIFDDILTTGATLGEAAKACKNAGAARVLCIALAH